MTQATKGRYSVVGRVLAAGFLLAIGLAAAMPFRNRERLRPPLRKATASDSVRLVFRNQDITLQVNPRVEESPAGPLVSPFPSPSEDAQSPAGPQLDDTARLPELPSQYRSLLDPNAIAPKGSRSPFDNTAGRTPPSPPAPREHVVADGDTLGRLAERYLGDASRAGDILAFNAGVIADPNLLPIGRVLRIPPRPTVYEPTAPFSSPVSTSTSIVREPRP